MLPPFGQRFVPCGRAWKIRRDDRQIIPFRSTNHVNHPSTTCLPRNQATGTPLIVRIILYYFPFKYNCFHICRRNHPFRFVHLVQRVTGKNYLFPRRIENLLSWIHPPLIQISSSRIYTKPILPKRSPRRCSPAACFRNSSLTPFESGERVKPLSPSCYANSFGSSRST